MICDISHIANITYLEDRYINAHFEFLSGEKNDHKKSKKQTKG